MEWPKIDAAEFAGYVGAAMILIWALLKAAGVIQSPVWVEMIPYVGASIGVGAIVFRAGRLVERVEVIARDLEKVTRRLDTLVVEVSSIDKRVAKIEVR